jgi:hypothetical protein
VRGRHADSKPLGGIGHLLILMVVRDNAYSLLRLHVDEFIHGFYFSQQFYT